MIEGQEKRLRLISEPFEIEIVGGESDKLVWGEAVGGLRAAVEFVPEKESYAPGDRVEVRLHIKNVSDKNVEFSSISTRQDYAIVKDGEGKEVKVDKRWHTGVVSPIRHILEPGQILVEKTSGLGFSDFRDAAILHKSQGPWVGSMARCRPGRYSVYYPINRTLNTGVRMVTVTEGPPVDPRKFELVPAGRSMLEAVNELVRKYRVRICFEQAGPGAAAPEQPLTGGFRGATIPELLESLTESGPYKWEKFNRTYVVYPRRDSVLRFFVKTSISDSPLEYVAGKILDQDPAGREIGIEASYTGNMGQHLLISRHYAMYALSRATEGVLRGDAVWSLTRRRGRFALSLHKMDTVGHGVTQAPATSPDAGNGAAEMKYEGRTIRQWMAQWDSNVSEDIDAATDALIRIGRPAVPALIEEVRTRSNYGWHAVGPLTRMGPEAEEAVAVLIEAALDRDLSFGDAEHLPSAYRGTVFHCMGDMTWARDRVVPVLQRIAEDREEDGGMRAHAIWALRKFGQEATPILRRLAESEERVVRDGAHSALAEILEEEGGPSKEDYYSSLIEKDPFDASVPKYLGTMKGIVNFGRPHAPTQRVKSLYRERLAEEGDADLAWRLAVIIANGLRCTQLEWAAPTDTGHGQWNREDPAESFATLSEVLALGFRHSEGRPELRRKFGMALAKLRLLEGDWDGMNAVLNRLGQEQIAGALRPWLAAPPVDWEEDLSSQWKIADESMRSGNCGLEFRVEKDGRGLKGVHILVKRAPEPANFVSTGFAADTLFFEPHPPVGDSFGSFGYKWGGDRHLTRYAVSDESGVVRFEGLPKIPVKIEVLVPTSNFPEAGSSWGLWMEVEPGKFKIAKVYGGADAVSWRGPPGVVELREGQTVRYPKLVVRPAESKILSDRFDGKGLDISVMAEKSADANDAESFKHYPGKLASNAATTTGHEADKGRVGRITSRRGAFALNEQIPINLDCPVVKDVWGNDQKPFKVGGVEFVERDERLHCSVKIEGATSADGKFIVRLSILGKKGRDSSREALLGVREFLFDTVCAVAYMPALIRESRDLNLGRSERFRYATVFEVQIEDITAAVGQPRERTNVTRFRGRFRKGAPVTVDLACPVVKDVWGNGQKPFRVETVGFVQKDERLHCAVTIDGTTSAEGTFIVRVKVYGRALLDPEREEIVALGGFLFESECLYADLPLIIREVESLDLGSAAAVANATGFEVEIEDIGRVGERADLAPDRDIRGSAVTAPPGETTDGLVQRLKSEDAGERRKAAERLGEMADAGGVEALVGALKDEEVGVRSAAARALGRIGDKRAIEPLVEAYRDQEYESFVDAIWALGDIGGEKAERTLIEALSYDGYHPYVRNIAAKSLRKLGWEPEGRGQRALYLIALEEWDKAVEAGPA
ncbi:MAG: HEAT repeat domain-containing protein, partial [Phycisphaerales bacterium]